LYAVNKDRRHPRDEEDTGRGPITRNPICDRDSGAELIDSESDEDIGAEDDGSDLITKKQDRKFLKAYVKWVRKEN